jgi:RpiB/LacA/LacB family sugar-phosphate isomerase
MNIFIAADHNGFKMKGEIAKWLEEEGHTVTDMGPNKLDQADDYPDFGFKVAETVAQDTQNNFGILVCGSGVGMSVVADKVKGVRAALIHDPEIARVAQKDDDINVLALGASFIDLENAKEVISAWLSTPFSAEERHVRRVKKITDYETGCCKGTKRCSSC